jgi:hypothetical protein
VQSVTPLSLRKIYGWFTEGLDTADLKDAKAVHDELNAWRLDSGQTAPRTNSGVYPWPPLDPRLRLLELSRYANQQIFAADRSDELNPHGKPFRSPVQS